MVPLSTFAYNDNRFNVVDILLVKEPFGYGPIHEIGIDFERFQVRGPRCCG